MENTEDVLAVSCLDTVSQSSLWDVHVINMVTYEDGVGDYLDYLEPNSGLLHYCNGHKGYATVLT